MTDDVLHLVRRATWGPTPGLLEEVAAKGPAAWLEEQLRPASVGDPVCDAFLGLFPRLKLSIAQSRARFRHGDWGTMQQLSYATIGRYTWSRRQLFEVVCDFWSNHLNVTNPVTALFADRHDYDANVVRRHAFGSFADMLVASSRHPSMLTYLDGRFSQVGSINQNYGREVLELHTVGVSGGYDEHAVDDVARVMTGWTFKGDGTAVFDPRRHDAGAFSVLGWSTGVHNTAAGPQVQESLLRHLAALPATARQIATKLCLRFVSDTPPDALVTRLAGTYLQNGTQIVPVLHALFASPEFAASAGAKTRRPLEGYVAAVRALGAMPGTEGAGGADVLFTQARSLGHAPLSWAPPNGYPDVAAAWVSAGSTLRRWNANHDLVVRRKPADLRWPASEPLLTSPPRTWGEFVGTLVQRLLYRPTTPREASALLQFCEKQAASPVVQGDPWLTTRFPALAAMALNAPAHMER
ncbi:DUF1800 domain-containing protein [Kineococcus sp. TBRC 1896]|uniref:DUF1800 domain-containing protein n=1 Tax=Kineococcus mangrovi TaxID=1660183 RepID=A0ABV4HXT1_9ACTN